MSLVPGASKVVSNGLVGRYFISFSKSFSPSVDLKFTQAHTDRQSLNEHGLKVKSTKWGFGVVISLRCPMQSAFKRSL